MKFLTELTIVINIITICIMAVALFYKFENPKHKAAYGYVIAGGFVSYIIALSLYILLSVILNHNFAVLFLILCVASPFVIGKLVKYETLKIYTFIQMLFFFASLLVLFVN